LHTWNLEGSFFGTPFLKANHHLSIPHFLDTIRDSILKLFSIRYFIEAIDRTLGNDWHQVGEAAPGDRKVGVTDTKLNDMTRDTLADEDPAPGAQTQIQVQGEGCQQDWAVPAL
jgi:hypothetical protein